MQTVAAAPQATDTLLWNTSRVMQTHERAPTRLNASGDAEGRADEPL